jgi:SAM-dependent methyltransferase
VDPADLRDIYRDYPLNSGRRLDVFARGTLGNLLSRLEAGGLRKGDRILDFGCGNGVALAFLRERGYTEDAGYDPFGPAFAALPADAREYDCVIANDVLEHVEDPRATLRACIDLVRPGGLLYVGTCDSESVGSMADLEPHLMLLHQPFHRVIITQTALLELGRELGLDLVGSWRRSYMDTLRPFANYRFLDEFNRALGHRMDLAFAPAAGKVLIRKPALLFYAFFGYLFPSAAEPAALWRRPSHTG